MTASSSKASAPIMPTITQITHNKDARYMVYAIHGLNSSTETWTCAPLSKSSKSSAQSFCWLDHLSAWLTENGNTGEEVNVSLIRWNTSIFSTANISTSIQDTVRPLAKSIVYTQKNNPGFTQPNVIFIGHSMGGILARALLGFMYLEIGAPNFDGRPRGADEYTRFYDDFLRATKGVILLASPSEGSIYTFVKYFTAAASSISGGLSVLINSAHIKALKKSAPEVKQIIQTFDNYCWWYQGELGQQLKVAAFRETKGIMKTPMVVSLASADIPTSTKTWVDHRTIDLEGLDHLHVTNLRTMQDANLLLILDQFLWMQGH